MSDFYLGKRSKLNLIGGHPHIVAVTELAIQLTEIDFSVIDGGRTEKEQRALVDSGASRTMDSRHMFTFDGKPATMEEGGVFHAVDVMAYLEGKGRWEFNLYYPIAYAFRDAARRLETPIIWGACWRVINNIDNLEEAVEQYVRRKKNQGKVPMLDAPHFHLCRKVFP